MSDTNPTPSDREIAAGFFRPCEHTGLLLCNECAAERVAEIRRSVATQALSFTAEFTRWWQEAGATFYGPGAGDEDEGLQELARLAEGAASPQGFEGQADWHQPSYEAARTAPASESDGRAHVHNHNRALIYIVGGCPDCLSRNTLLRQAREALALVGQSGEPDSGEQGTFPTCGICGAAEGCCAPGCYVGEALSALDKAGV